MSRPNRIPALAIDNHPDLVTNPAIALNPARYALRQMWEQWGKLQEAEVVVTDKKRLAAAAGRVVTHAEKVSADALKNLQDFRDEIERKLASEVTPRTPDAAATEIRSFWKSQRHPFKGLASLVQQKDRRTLAAILNAPPYLSGLTNDQHQELLAMARNTWFPEETKTVEDIDRHAGRVMLAMAAVKKTLTPLIQEWSGVDEDKALEGIVK